jgi:hypothetical protein
MFLLWTSYWIWRWWKLEVEALIVWSVVAGFPWPRPATTGMVGTRHGNF